MEDLKQRNMVFSVSRSLAKREFLFCKGYTSRVPRSDCTNTCQLTRTSFTPEASDVHLCPFSGTSPSPWTSFVPRPWQEFLCNLQCPTTSVFASWAHEQLLQVCSGVTVSSTIRHKAQPGEAPTSKEGCSERRALLRRALLCSAVVATPHRASFSHSTGGADPAQQRPWPRVSSWRSSSSAGIWLQECLGLLADSGTRRAGLLACLLLWHYLRDNEKQFGVRSCERGESLLH